MNGVDEARGVGTGAVEVATSLVLAVLGAVAMWDSRRIGAGWGEDDPQSGTFPFWIGLILVGASLGTLAQAVRPGPGGATLFVTWPQLRLVLSVLLPTIVYVAAIPTLGIYIASALLVAYCMVARGAGRPRDRARRVRHVRDLVPRRPAERPHRGRPRLLTPRD